MPVARDALRRAPPADIATSIGTSDGNIIAIIITVHMPMNVAAAPNHVWPGIRIQAIDIVQPPGISMPGIADMEPHQMTVTTALAKKASAETADTTRGQTFAYSSWRLHHTPVSLRPSGARSSHWYAPHRPSRPRAYVEYV